MPTWEIDVLLTELARDEFATTEGTHDDGLAPGGDLPRGSLRLTGLEGDG